MTGMARGTSVAFALAMVLATDGTEAGVSTGHVLPNHISVCFVGDAVTKRPFRVMQVMASVKQYQYAANIHFNFLGACPPARRLPNGNDFYAGDIRVVIEDVSVDALAPVPGRGCTDKDPNGTWRNWAYYPEDVEKFRSCLYTLKLGDTGPAGIPYLNTALHEFGHALGLYHEHERRDVDHSLCNDKDFGGKLTDGLVTRYDPQSVMHYKMCSMNGNYDYTGLSPLDQLTMHILYPEDSRVAEFEGTTVVEAGAHVILRSAWKQRGANIPYAARDFEWKIDGRTVGSGPDLDIPATAGSYTLSYAYRDFLGRTYAVSGPLLVLSHDDFIKKISGPLAARSVLY